MHHARHVIDVGQVAALFQRELKGGSLIAQVGVSSSGDRVKRMR
jgi:hypothetical protein